MCAIVGAIVPEFVPLSELEKANKILNHIIRESKERGRDGRGFLSSRGTYKGTEIFIKDTNRDDGQLTTDYSLITWSLGACIVIGNLRAEPTTEFVLKKSADDQQPYQAGKWSIVHNGTIANDKELRTGEVPTNIDSAAIAEILSQEDQWTPPFVHFAQSIRRLKGSFAILASRKKKDGLYVAANYRPIWYIQTDVGTFFASSRDYFPPGFFPVMLKPYTIASFSYTDRELTIVELPLHRPAQAPKKALVVCSGGMDSVVAATFAKNRLNMEVSLIHFLYGSRAQGPEVDAVRAVSKELNVPLRLFPLNVYSKADSPLLNADSKVAGGEEGAEFAHEWVPARNLLLLSVATAYAEANGYDVLVLGNNLEEAGAYPDNEPEFIRRFNDLLPFAVGDGKHLEVIMPVGNLMKHEIVKLGLEIKAPLHLTWSCYRAGEKHCGTCGPCYMRRKAFEINNCNEVISYER